MPSSARTSIRPGSAGSPGLAGVPACVPASATERTQGCLRGEEVGRGIDVEGEWRLELDVARAGLPRAEGMLPSAVDAEGRIDDVGRAQDERVRPSPVPI